MVNFPKVFVTAAPNCKVRLAGGGVVPATGIRVPRDFFIDKLISIGDLIVDDGKTAALDAEDIAAEAAANAVAEAASKKAAQLSTAAVPAQQIAAPAAPAASAKD